MKFSQSLDLALHALWYLAHNSPENPVMVKELAKNVCASESYLARVMLWLAKAGIVRSIRGKRGGFTFKRPPEQITIADIVVAIDKDAAEYSCSWEERSCENEGKCSLVRLFHEAQHQMLEVLKKMTIAELAEIGDLGKKSNTKWLTPPSDEKEEEIYTITNPKTSQRNIVL